MLALPDLCQANSTARGRMCACLEPKALGRLRSVAGDSRLGPGDVLFAPGDAADCVYGLRHGAVMLSSRLGDGRRQVLSFLFPGDIFGFTDDGRHACTAQALTRAGFCRMPLAGLEGDPQLSLRLHLAARARMADALEHTLRLGRMRAGERLADFLYWLWRRLEKPSELHLPMRQLDIADHLGLRLETVSRQLSGLRRAGLVGPLGTDGVLPILNGPALRQR